MRCNAAPGSRRRASHPQRVCLQLALRAFSSSTPWTASVSCTVGRAGPPHCGSRLPGAPGRSKRPADQRTPIAPAARSVKTSSNENTCKPSSNAASGVRQCLAHRQATARKRSNVLSNDRCRGSAVLPSARTAPPVRERSTPASGAPSKRSFARNRPHMVWYWAHMHIIRVNFPGSRTSHCHGHWAELI